MIVEYIPYTLFLLAVCFIAYNYKIPRNKRIMLIFVITTIFSSVRFNVGHDYMGYYYAVLSPQGSDADRFEPIVKTMCYVLQGHPFAFMLITSIFTHFFLFKSIKSFSPSLTLPILAFICMPFFFLNFMCVIRFGMAVTLMLYAYLSYIHNRKISHFIFAYIIAINCHITALVTLIFLLPFEKISKNIHILFLVGSLLVGQIVMNYFINMDIGSIMNAYYARYLINEDMEEGKKMLVIYAMLAILNLFAFYRAKDNDIHKRKIYSMINIGFCLLFLFSYNLTFAGRISRFFIIPIIIAIQYYKIPLLSLKVSAKILTFSLISLLFAELYISQNSFYTTKSKSYMPYETIIFMDN